MSEEKVEWKEVLRLNRFPEGKEMKYLQLLVKKVAGKPENIYIGVGSGATKTMLKLADEEALLLSEMIRKTLHDIWSCKG